MTNEAFKLFEPFAIAKGYEAYLTNEVVLIKNVTNPGNNFSIRNIDGYYAVITEKVSYADYEYTAKCMVYLLLAEFNKSNSTAKHLHINFRVDL